MKQAEWLKEKAKSREDIYCFLAAIYREELTAEQIRQMMEHGVPGLLVELGCDIESDFFTEQTPEQIEEALACEFAALFIGPGEHISPYESIYVPDSSGRVGYYWGECTVDMKNWVEHYSLKISDGFKSIPDHISVELEFMQRLVEQERMAWERGDEETAKRCMEVERRFFEKHLIKWIPAFCDKVMEKAELDFYREVAKLTKSFIIQEYRDLLGKESRSSKHRNMPNTG
jgi:TorA maturation chaperone TorD